LDAAILLGEEDPMTGRPRVRVVQLQRRSFVGHYSMERVFAEIRGALPGWLDVELRVTSHYNKGLLPRVRTMLESRRQQGEVTHVTGDINYAAILLRRRTTVLTVHDTEFLDRAGGAKRFLYTWLWLRLPVWRAGLVTVPSEATRQAVLRLVRTNPDHIRVVPNPVADDFTADPGRPVQAPPVVLLVGTRPNKNIERAAAALRGLGCRIVVVGDLSPSQQAAFIGAGLDFEVRSGLSEAEIRQAYRDSDLLLFPSTKEGFGIPVLEAQATGRPVVTSDRPPLPDVAGGAACLVDPLDVASIRAGVQRVLSDETYRADLVRRGLANVPRFGVRAVAARYAAIYDELARRR
jgi:glycosyltransferase involved in cell wall biosynthesis